MEPTYTCGNCGMSVNMTCGECGSALVNDVLTKEDGIGRIEGTGIDR